MSFKEFWPFYLQQHQNPACRAAHYLGTGIGGLLILLALFTRRLELVFAALLVGYGCSWFGHYVFEKNRPATFRYPWQSFLGDWKMFLLWSTGRIKGHLKDLAKP